MKTSLKRSLAALGLLALNLQIHAQGFALSSTPGVGSGPYSVAAADVNGDGKMDLVCANNNASTFTVLTNDGSGVLVSNVSYATSANPQTLVAADLNADGKVDLVCVCGSQVMVLTNNGGGGLVSAGVYAHSGGLPWIVVADINGGGKPDMLFQATIGQAMLALTNAGNGSFAVAPSPPSNFLGSRLVVAADVNGDGKLDLIDMPTGLFYLRILTNAGNGNFVLSSTNFASSNWPGYILATDVNGDGKVDLFVSNYASGGGKTVLVLTNNGNGLFGSNAVYAAGFGPLSGAAADVNGDGMVDLISADLRGDMTILTNSGSGFGSNATLHAQSFASVHSVVAADVNGDGRLDLIAANNSSPGTLSIWTNTMTFLPKLRLTHPSNNIVVSWSSQWTEWAGWTLQQNTDLNTTNWTAFSGTVGDDGTTKAVTNTSPQENLFFRLSHR